MARPGQWFLPGCRPASSVAESVGAQKNDGHFHCDGVDRWTAPHFMHERGNFGEIGTRPDNIQYFRALAHEVCASASARGIASANWTFGVANAPFTRKKHYFNAGAFVSEGELA